MLDYKQREPHDNTCTATCPVVGNLTMFCYRIASPSSVDAIIRFTTLVVAFLSAVVGCDVSG